MDIQVNIKCLATHSRKEFLALVVYFVQPRNKKMMCTGKDRKD
jgi:hypothetical protein